MLKSYFKIAWRTITNHRVYSIINVLGLSLGLCACVVIYLITSFEFSFDSFHPGKERIYRIVTYLQINGFPQKILLGAPASLPDALRKQIPGLEEVASYHLYYSKITIRLPANKPARNFDSKILGSYLPSTIVTGPQYFNIFKYEWLAGNPASALHEPFQVVLTETKAHKYFGSVPIDDMIGKVVVYDDSLPVTVTGIVKDWDKNTDFPFTDFISLATARNTFLNKDFQLDDPDAQPSSSKVFMKLSAGTSPAGISDQLKALYKKKSFVKSGIEIQSLKDIHFNDEFAGREIRTAHLPTLYALMMVAAFILILAVINYINLSTARSIQRAKEIGVRKVLGSSRKSLVFQFLSETFVLTSFAVFIAVLLVKPVLSAFSAFIPRGVEFDPAAPSVSVFIVLITVFTSLFAGFYPAKVLSSYLPVQSLKGSGMQKGGEKWYLRKGLIVFQFSISMIFIIGAIVIGKQIRYMHNKDLGFNSDAIVSIDTNESDSTSKVKLLAEKIRQVAGVANVALQSISPMGADRVVVTLKYQGERMVVSQKPGDVNFIPLYRMKLLAGRNFGNGDSIKEFVINESYAKALGFTKPNEAVGKLLYQHDDPYTIVGVVADFHEGSFHEPIKPIVIGPDSHIRGIAIKLTTKGKQVSDAKAIMKRVEMQWKKIYPHDVFTYTFLDKSISLLYEKERNTAWLMNIATGITIFISCLGLFGLVMFTVSRKIKEIGIRKVMGADMADIIIMLNRDFVILIVIAIVIASPVAWYGMNQWLQDFAYRTNINWWVFVLAGLTALVIGLLTVSFQAIKAAIANPVEALRNE